jgi:hypothetical protein
MSQAAHFVPEHGFVGQGAPVLIRLAAEISSRFGMVVSQKIAAQAVPVVGALGVSPPPSETGYMLGPIGTSDPSLS